MDIISSKKLADKIGVSEEDIQAYAKKMSSTKIGLVPGKNGTFICNEAKYMDQLESLSARKEAIHMNKVRAGKRAARTRAENKKGRKTTASK